MGPRRRRFWLPLARLGAFFAAVVVVGNLILHAAFTPAETETEPGRALDYLGRQKRRIEKRIRSFERLFFGPHEESISAPAGGARACPAEAHEAEGAEAGAIWMADPVVELVQESEPLAVAGLPPILAAPEAAPETLPFAWPLVLPPPVRPPIEPSILDPLLTPEFVAEFYRFGAPAPLGGVGDALLRGPEALLDGLLGLAGRIFPRSGSYSLPYDEDDGITSRLLDFELGPREGRIFTEFMGHLAEREQRFFLRFAGSGLDTVGVENGTEDVDSSDLMREQGKVLWDALRKTYFSKYKFRGEDRIRDDAFYFNQWRGVDFAVLPPLIAGYVYYRGIEKRFSMGETWLRFSIEPLSRWVSGREDLVAGVSMEWGIKGFPIGLIVSAGMYDGRAELDFVGIGTSVGMVRKVLDLQRGE